MFRIAIYTAISLVVSCCSSSGVAGEFHVAFWNVENLFNLEDDPAVELDEEFTPQSPKRWTAERLERKLNNLASILRKMNQGRGPDVLGLSEVENRKVLQMLVDKLAPLGRNYAIVHQDSPSDRGIDCALVYDANVFGLSDSQFHFVDAEKTRDIVEAKLRHNRADLFVFVNHWPSRNNDQWQRVKAAGVLRARLDEIFAADPNTDVLVIGDFNDEPDDVSLRVHLRAAGTPDNLPAGSLYNTTAPLAAQGKGTIVWDNAWQLLDQIIVSPGLLDDDGFRLKPDSSQPLEFPQLFYRPRDPRAIRRPSRSYSRDQFHEEGYSDHLPVVCVIEQ